MMANLRRGVTRVNIRGVNYIINIYWNPPVCGAIISTVITTHYIFFEYFMHSDVNKITLLSLYAIYISSMQTIWANKKLLKNWFLRRWLIQFIIKELPKVGDFDDYARVFWLYHSLLTQLAFFWGSLFVFIYVVLWLFWLKWMLFGLHDRFYWEHILIHGVIFQAVVRIYWIFFCNSSIPAINRQLKKRTVFTKIWFIRIFVLHLVIFFVILIIILMGLYFYDGGNYGKE
jgi:hypothetical protein